MRRDHSYKYGIEVIIPAYEITDTISCGNIICTFTKWFYSGDELESLIRNNKSIHSKNLDIYKGRYIYDIKLNHKQQKIYDGKTNPFELITPDTKNLKVELIFS